MLAAHPFAAGLAPAHVALLVGCAENVRFAPGEFLFRMGGAAVYFYLVREGRVAVEVAVPGRPAIVVQTVGAGDVLGWAWLVPPHRWTFDAVATEDTRALRLDGACLRGKCEADHELGYQLLRRFVPVVAQRLEATRLQLLDLYGEAGR